MVYTIKLKKLRESKFCVCDKDSIPSIIFDFRTPAKEPLPGDPPVNSSSLEKSLLAGYPGVPTVLDDSQVFISLCFIKNFFLNFIEFFLQLVSCLRILYLYFALGLIFSPFKNVNSVDFRLGFICRNTQIALDR